MANMSNIEILWSKWFDKIYCCWFLPSKGRFPRLKAEMERLGLWSNPVFELRKMVPQKMEEVILAVVKGNVPGSCNRLFEVGLGMENIRIMKEALLQGYERIMIIEDDAAFLKDKTRIIEILDAMPSGFEMIQMDKAIHSSVELEYYNRLLLKNRLNSFFVDSSEKSFTLSTCNVYTREGMEKCVAEMEDRMGVIDCIAGHMKGEPALAVENLAIQVIYGKCNNKDFYKDMNRLHDVYSIYGLDYAKYAVPEGYGYGSLLEG